MGFMDILNDVANAIDKRQEEVKRKTRRELKKMTDEQLIAAGIPAGLVRMSCGLENKEDLIEDIRQALEF